MNISSIGEFGLIDSLKPFCLTSKQVIKTIGDDAAVLAYTKDKYQLFTTDMLAQDVHFTLRMKPELIGHKALACNISDIAAMGGVPTFAVVSIALPKTLHVQWVKDFYQGMGRLAKQFNVSIVGGDTIQSSKIVVNIALLGEVEKKYLVTRDGAKPGDLIFVTGALGGSFKSGRHLSFTPQLEQARFLVEHFKPSAMMDISDGLAGDLSHILKESCVGAQLWFDSIPKHKGVSLKEAMTDGEDYQLLFTLSAIEAKQLMNWQANKKSLYFYPIGYITKDKRVNFNDKGFNHFV